MSLRPATVDNLVADTKNSRKIIINQQPYISRPRRDGKVIPYYSIRNIRKRIYHAWLVLTSQAIAVQYSEDGYKKSEIQTITFE